MWMWHGYWGGPWGIGWLFPLLGIVVMILMIVTCVRRMGGTAACGCMSGHGTQPPSVEIDALRREVQSLREEVRAQRSRHD